MLKLNASEASRKKIEIEPLRANSCNLMQAKRGGKISKLKCRERRERKIFENFALFPPILAS